MGQVSKDPPVNALSPGKFKEHFVLAQEELGGENRQGREGETPPRAERPSAAAPSRAGGGERAVTAKPGLNDGRKNPAGAFCSPTWPPATPRILPWKGGRRGRADIGVAP